MMKLFKIRGGVHPDDHKRFSAQQAIETLPIPPLLHIPMQQHIGAMAEPLVQRGDLVKKGQLIARHQGMVSAPVHASTSGRIVGIGSYPAHHSSGLLVRTITLKPDNEDAWADDVQPIDDPFALSPEEIASKVAQAGIVGMGGATFPSAVKLNLHKRYDLHTLVINGAECEPYLTCDDRLMQEHAHAVVEGVLLMARALKVEKVLFSIENNKPLAQKSIAEAGRSHAHFEVVSLPTRYPMGSEKHLVQTLTGKETPARGLTADIGIVVHNVSTAYAVYEALREGKPLISRVVTVTGPAIKQARNLRVLIGTPVSHLIQFCGGLTKKEDAVQLISGGPMMGQPLSNTQVPVVKGSNGLLALNKEPPKPEQACIRCASCVRACPCGLTPLEMAAHIRRGSLDDSVKLGLLDCISCGSCAYVCPANIPLVQYFNYAKGELASRQRVQHKQQETKRLAEVRTARMEALKRARQEKMSQRKQEVQQQKQANAEET